MAQQAPYRSPREIAAAIQLAGVQQENARLKGEIESLTRSVDRITQIHITSQARITELKTVLLKFTKCIPVRVAGRKLMREGERKLRE